ncbi:SLAP domain-containing protein [Lactobacillus delbrueckii]|nr:SLAP domain-containing protein [Lactobacillus delbrueckii]
MFNAIHLNSIGYVFEFGKQVFTYGGKRKIGKKTYYRINVGRYIKAGNVK